MSNYNDPYNDQKKWVAQQAVKPTAPQGPGMQDGQERFQPSMESAPTVQAAPPVRHRRSDRYKAGDAPAPAQREERAAAPRREAPQQEAPRRESPQQEGLRREAPQQEAPQWVRRQPPAEPGQDENMYPNPGSRRGSKGEDEPFMRRPVALEDEYEDEENDRRPFWPKLLLWILLIVVLLFAALYFVPNAGPLNPLKNAVVGCVDGVVNMVSPQHKEPAQALSFQAASNSGVAGSQLVFHLTTTTNVEGVRIEDAEGNEIGGSVSLVNGADETTKIWEIKAVFATPYEGEVYAAIKEKGNWVRTDKWVPLTIAEPTPIPTQVPVPTAFVTQKPVTTPGAREGKQTPAPTAAPTEVPVAAVIVKETEVPAVAAPTWAPTNAPAPTAAPTQAPTAAPATEAPTPAPTQEPTPVPTPVPTRVPTPSPMPSSSPLPRLSAISSDAVGVTDRVYRGGSSLEDFQREDPDKHKEGYIAPHPDEYSYYGRYGVLTFRGDNFRRNPAFGRVNVADQKLSVEWKAEIGGLRTDDNGTLYGVGWTGQPSIIKWTKESREMMNLYPEKKATKALTEVIFGAQDGKIYFLDLKDGQPTRDTINVGFPLKGSVAVDPFARPLLAVGQGISKLPGKTGDIGLHVYNLITGEKEFMINGRKSDSQRQYSTNGAFDGTPLFLYGPYDALIGAGENGLLYTVDLNSTFTYPTAEKPETEGSISTNPDTIYLRTKGNKSSEKDVGVESSVAMYDKYIFMADTYGILRCVDSDTMTTVWAFDNGDNTDAAIALDMENDSTLSLYTGNTAFRRLGSKKDVSIRKLDALTGEELWAYEIRCEYDKDQQSGVKASPVIGQHGLDHLVFFTVNMVQGGKSRIIALDKENGSVVWEKDLSAESISSPVAVYNEAGKGWIIQADESGKLLLMDGLNGQVLDTLELGGKIQGSPAVYRDMLVIGTCSRDNSYMYGIRIH